MFCNNCGKELEAGDVFCVYCGARLELVQSTEERPVTPVLLVSGSTTVSQDTSTTLGTRPAVARKSPVGWIVAVVLLVVAGIVVLMYGNRTEYYNELTWGGGRKNIPVLVQKVKSVGTYEAEYKLFKLSRIHWQQGSEKLNWEIGSEGNLIGYNEENTELCRKWGVHAIKRKYDSAGNATRIACYGADGRLKEDSDGFAIYESEYDSAGNRTRVAIYGADGRLKEDSYGFAIFEYEHDSAGNRTREAGYGADGRLKGDDLGVAIYEREYDSAGNVVVTRCYDADYKILYIF